MRFSLRVQVKDSVSDMVEFAKRAEQVGFDTFWHTHDVNHKYCWVDLTAVALATKRMRIGPLVVNPYTCNPTEIAMAITTLDEVSGGRCILGLGAGAYGYLGPLGLRTEEYRPIRAVKEASDVIRTLIRGETVNYQGKFLRWQNVRLAYKPVRDRIPIYIAAKGSQMMELIGKIGDGGVPDLFPPEYVTKSLELIASGASKRGRDLGEIEVQGLIWFSVSTDEAKAKDASRYSIGLVGPRLLPKMLEVVGLKVEDFAEIKEVATKRGLADAARLVTDDMVDRLAISGTPDQCVERLKRLEKAGLGHVVLGPRLGPNEQESLRLFAEKVMPSFAQG